MRRPWLLIVCTIAGMLIGLPVGSFILSRFVVEPPRPKFVTLEIIAMENRQVKQIRVGIAVSIALGGAAGLATYDGAMRWRGKKCSPPEIDDSLPQS
jgi:ABC-type Fe3+ transport system permease subunit